MVKQHLIESQIDINLGICHARVPQRVIVEQLDIAQVTISHLFRKYHIDIFKTRHSCRQYRCSIIDRDNRLIARLVLKFRRIIFQDLTCRVGLNPSKKRVSRCLKKLDIRMRVTHMKSHLLLE